MKVDTSRPFQVMMHDGTFNTLDFQPGRDFVGCGGVADFPKLLEEYRESLIASGMSKQDADAKAARTKGGLGLMTEQFMVMGLGRGLVLNDREANKKVWEQISKVSRIIVGGRVGAAPREKEVTKSYVRPTPSSRNPGAHITNWDESPRLSEVAALADRIGEQVEKYKRGED